jgi:hypothetical protein
VLAGLSSTSAYGIAILRRHGRAHLSKDRFQKFYRDMFDHQVKKVDLRAVFTEYAWDMNWCDPCAAEPLSFEELRGLGAFWLTQDRPEIVPNPMIGGARDVFVTRMHVRYDAEHFPKDLILQETADHNNFQARYVLRHPWQGDCDCPATEDTGVQSYNVRKPRRASLRISRAGTWTKFVRKWISHPRPTALKKDGAKNLAPLTKLEQTDERVNWLVTGKQPAQDG